MKRKPDLEKRAAALYDSRLPYHNFEHALKVVAAGEAILARCRSENIHCDEEAVYYAMLLHDAGYHEDHAAMGFSSKEAYSAHLACELLAELSVPQAVIDKVESAILCTHVNGSCRSVEDRVVRQADLAGMAADYECFRTDTMNLKRELELMTGESISWQEWKRRAQATISRFLGEDMGLTSTDYDGDGKPLFEKRVRRNIETMLKDDTLHP